ncbi:MAG: DegV family protein [Burkholderiales bacterium]|nr:DegV family protein [Burkholderiales bacterium]
MQPRHPTVPFPSARPQPTYEADAYAKSLPGMVTRESRAAHAPLRPPVVDAPAPASDATRTLLVADASCDLPEAWLATHQVLTLPLRIRTASDSVTDGRSASDVARRRAFLAASMDIGVVMQRSIALSVAGTEELIAAQLNDGADFVLAITQAARRSAVHGNTLAAAQNLMQRVTQARQRQASRHQAPARPFKIWVVDGDAANHATAVLLCEAQRLLAAGERLPQVVQRLDALRRDVQTIVLPADLRHLHAQSATQADTPLSWLSYGVDRMLNRTPVLRFAAHRVDVLAHHRGQTEAMDATLRWTAQQVSAGLAAPHVCVSVAGDTDAVGDGEGWAVLAATCRDYGVALHLATMSISNALALGRGAIAIALAPKKSPRRLSR